MVDKNRIAESGTHDELLKKNGVYRKIWESQVGTDNFGKAKKAVKEVEIKKQSDKNAVSDQEITYR